VEGRPTSTTRRRRWTDDAIENELRAQIAALGRFPTRSELVASGLRSLWEAMRVGGVEMWRARLTDEHAGPSHEAIAARAYQLYEQGAPGDAVQHWLAAERDLSTRSR
jgi:Arc/MetJ-type ribon-helix-helix transcriptional regulator